MKAFMDKDFILETETAQHLYHDYAAKMPLIDYHCHISPKEIYEDRRFNNLVEVWLGGKNPDGSYFGDHYKWRLMRSNGVPEDYVTGDKPAYDRYIKFVEALEMAIGNPMVHWCNLELKFFFGYDKPLTLENAKDCWDFVNDKLQNDPELTVRGMMKKANVYMVGTTDDPVDSLEWHEKIAADKSFGIRVCPSFRPDKAINIHKAGFTDYIAKLAASVGKDTLSSADEVIDALLTRLDFFAKLGCRASDHGLDTIPCRVGTKEEVNTAFAKAMAGEKLTTDEIEKYQTAILLALGKAYHKRGIVMQLHYSCKRNPNARAFRVMGADTGYDIVAQNACGGDIADLLSLFEETGELPKTVLYSLNPNDNELLGSLIGAFQSDEIPGKIQHGSAWWFNDTKSGMEAQIKSLANLGILGNFIGMLTDSRSFLSYPRHEYFRRILCNIVGSWVENGEYPNDEKALRKIIEGVSFGNAKRYFGI